MKLTIEPTAEFQKIEGAQHRIWKGVDENGTKVHVWVRTLQPQTHDPERLAAFDRELDALPPLRECGMTIDHRFIAD